MENKMETTKMGYIGSILGIYEEPSSLGEVPLKMTELLRLPADMLGNVKLPTRRPDR